MADHYPLIVSSGVVQELPASENLNLSSSGIVGLSSLNVNGVDVTPIGQQVTYYVTTSGNDSTGDGSVGNPWASPHRALEYLREKRISVTEGYNRVTVNIGIGTYQFGLKTVATGGGYIDGVYDLVSSGSGSGAQVGITTTGSGEIETVKLLDPGVGYASSETVTISGPGAGSGATLLVLKVGTEGHIYGPIYADHLDGSQILITGAGTTGTKPGSRGNHFYNQAGVGVGSDPTGTGPNYTWSAVYDSTSPAGAYPNPMADGRGNTVASEVYNLTILQSYYQSELYFYGCDGIVASTPNASTLDNLLLVGVHADGSNPKAQNVATSGITNTPVTGVTTDTGLRWTRRANVIGGNLLLGENVSIHGFEYGVYFKGGGAITAQRLTVTNTGSVGVIIDKNSYAELPNLVSLNNPSHSLYSYNGTVIAVSAVCCNNGSIGVLNYYNGWTMLGSTDENPEYPDSIGYGNSTIIANNNSYGINAQAGSVIRADGRYSDILYVYGNGSVQVRATTGGIVEHQGASARKVVEQASGGATTYSPTIDTIGNNNAIINTTL